MLVKPSLANRKKYCSRQCLGRATIKGKTAHRRKPTNNPSWFTADRVKGANNTNWVESLNLTCEYCAAQFSMKPWVYRVRNKHNGRVRFCSKICFRDYRRFIEIGKRSPYWLGGHDRYYGREWELTRLRVVSEQHGLCAHCNVEDPRLHVHHILPARCCETWEAANARDNLVGLCQRCHSRAERDSRRLSAHLCKHPKHHERIVKTECKHGHAFTPENTYFGKDGYQRCRQCTNARQRAYHQRLREAR